MSKLNILDLLPELRSVYESKEATGLSSINNLETIRNIILDQKPKRTLEVGLAYGGSALTILSSLTSIHGNQEDFLHVAVDPGQSSFNNAGINVINESGYSDHFQFIGESSATALARISTENEKFGFIYIDGYHIFEHVLIDVFFSIYLLEQGGIVTLDDCTDPHVRKVIKFINTNLSKQLVPFDLTDYLPEKSFKKKVANKFGYSQIKAFKKVGELPREWNSELGRF